MAFRFTAGSLARVSSEDVLDVAPVADKTLNTTGSTDWSRARHAFHSDGKVYLSDLGESFAAYDAPSGGTLTRSSADDFDLGTVTWPSSLVSRAGVGWIEGGWFYMIRGTNVIANRLTRVDLTNNLQRDTADVEIAGAAFPRKLLAFGGHMHVGTGAIAN